MKDDAPKKHWTQRDAIAFIQEAIDVASQAADENKPRDIARALVSIADAAGAAALDGDPLTVKQLNESAPPETVDFVLNKHVTSTRSSATEGIRKAVSLGRASLGLDRKPGDTKDDV